MRNNTAKSQFNNAPHSNAQRPLDSSGGVAFNSLIAHEAALVEIQI